MNDHQPSTARSDSDASDRRSIALLTGAAAIFAGVLLIVWPDITLLLFSQIAGWCLGVIGLLRAIELAQSGRFRTWELVRAVLAGVLGIALIVWPGETLVVVTVILGIWLIFDGGSRVLGTMYSASPMDEVIGNLLGVVEFFVGLAVVVRPVAGVRASAVLAGIGMIVHGLARIWDGFRGPPADAPPSSEASSGSGATDGDQAAAEGA